jgi:negative regulator of flagellin synthesis FlgM
MRISGNVQGVAGIYTNDKKISKVENVNKLSLGRDDIKISSKAKDYSVAMNALKNIPDVRQDKVDEVAKKLANGEYKVSGDDIADKILNDSFDASI